MKPLSKWCSSYNSFRLMTKDYSSHVAETGLWDLHWACQRNKKLIVIASPKWKKITTDVSTPKKNKQVVKAVGDSGTNNCSTSKNRTDSNTNCKRKFEALTKVATYAEHVDGQSPTKYLQASESIDLIVLRYFDFTDPLLFLLIIMKKSLNYRCPSGQEQTREQL